MTGQHLSTLDRLSTRATALNLKADAATLTSLAAYFDLLQRWNEKINLTSLGDSDEAIDRLIMEPLAAAAFLPSGGTIVDVGSGGGSPALPLAIALRSPSLVMVESRGRKAAFLREALRTLDLKGTVETDRAEMLAGRADFQGTARIISIRAVRMTSPLCVALANMLSNGGVLAMFSKHSEPIPDGFRPAGAHSLVAATQSFLHCFTPIK
ncbi:MAG TPA: RsmG family class I SAM-dependent methyltransferase [Vicinamibacterales bacterium]|nr:RsmG family class I SAM-dependent methyltransferase [Vicinamibacterales bacterium]